jgi:hypothetical protein
VRGLSVSGTKTDLYQRIVEAILTQEQKDSGVVGVISNVKLAKVVKPKGKAKGKKESPRKQARAVTEDDEDDDGDEEGKKKSTSFAFSVPSISAPTSSSSASFTPFSPFAPPVSSGFAVPLPSTASRPHTRTEAARKEKADADNILLGLDFNGATCSFFFLLSLLVASASY